MEVSSIYRRSNFVQPWITAGRKVLTAKKIMGRSLKYVCGKSDFTWRYLANLRPSFEYQRIRKPLSVSQERILSDLRRDGISMTSVTDLMTDNPVFHELQFAVRTLETSLSDKISKARMEMDTPSGVKSYCFHLLSCARELDPNDIFVRFALQPQILGIANGYFGMLTRLLYYNVWHNFPMQDEPRESQLWHRDPEDRYILKMFVYLTDVDEGSGPLSYVPGTHAQGSVRTRPASKICKEGSVEVRRSDDAQMLAVLPKENWITALGPKGTVVFADTRGYHKGGLVRERDRILYTCMFNSQASSYPNLFERKLIPPDADEAVAFAIGRSKSKHLLTSKSATV
jgi:hypothetical protein